MNFFQSALKSMAKGFEHAHNEDNLNFSIKSYNGTTTKASESQVYVEPQIKQENKNSKRRYIAMYLGSDLPESMMTYLIDSCHQVGHDLIVLSFEQNSTTDKTLAPYMQELEKNDIRIKKVKLSGEPIQELTKYLKTHRNIEYLACKDSGFLGRSYLSGNIAKLSLPIPLVVVTTNVESGSTKSTDLNEKDNSQIKVA